MKRFAKRFCAWLGLSFLLVGADLPARHQGMSGPDIVEMGRVSAGLSDWQTMAYFLMAVIAIMVALIAWLIMRFLSAATAMSGAMSATNIVLSRVEMAVRLPEIQRGIDRQIDRLKDDT
jgi:hypothetical protein